MCWRTCPQRLNAYCNMNGCLLMLLCSKIIIIIKGGGQIGVEDDVLVDMGDNINCLIGIYK